MKKEEDLIVSLWWWWSSWSKRMNERASQASAYYKRVERKKLLHIILGTTPWFPLRIFRLESFSSRSKANSQATTRECDSYAFMGFVFFLFNVSSFPWMMKRVFFLLWLVNVSILDFLMRQNVSPQWSATHDGDSRVIASFVRNRLDIFPSRVSYIWLKWEEATNREFNEEI